MFGLSSKSGDFGLPFITTSYKSWAAPHLPSVQDSKVFVKSACSIWGIGLRKEQGWIAARMEWGLGDQKPLGRKEA